MERGGAVFKLGFGGELMQAIPLERYVPNCTHGTSSRNLHEVDFWYRIPVGLGFKFLGFEKVGRDFLSSASDEDRHSSKHSHSLSSVSRLPNIIRSTILSSGRIETNDQHKTPTQSTLTKQHSQTMFSTVVVPTTISAANQSNKNGSNSAAATAATQNQQATPMRKPFSNSAESIHKVSDTVKSCLKSTTYETTEAAKVVL